MLQNFVYNLQYIHSDGYCNSFFQFLRIGRAWQVAGESGAVTLIAIKTATPPKKAAWPVDRFRFAKRGCGSTVVVPPGQRNRDWQAPGNLARGQR